ncbi:MAG: phosphotransferase family protein [Proteobacteria bacterium]|nr:phosphotransferase family protein [Pseudomonadota bacterium]MDA1351931.1 phosphotransferase family protein [Pseudomonadota bacterium]
MSEVNTLNENALAAYLEANMAGFKGPLTATKFQGGQSNPTFKIDAVSDSYVLRRQPPGKLLKSAHAVDREFRVISALADTDVPVAHAHHLCEDPEIIGSMFYLMEFCDGNIHWASKLDGASSNQKRAHMYDEMNRVLAAIHSVDLEKAGLLDFGRPGNYYQRQFDRWSSQYRASEMGVIAEMDQLINWLGENIPIDDGKVSLVHGDYRLDNLMYSKDDHQIIAVLDWELSTLGHPYADLAYQCMGLRLPVREIKNVMSGLGGIEAQALGIPSEREYVAKYCQRMGIDKIDNWSFYLAFSCFRLAAITQGVAKRGVDGNASSQAALGYGEMVKPLAVMGLDISKTKD